MTLSIVLVHHLWHKSRQEVILWAPPIHGRSLPHPWSILIIPFTQCRSLLLVHTYLTILEQLATAFGTSNPGRSGLAGRKGGRAFEEIAHVEYASEVSTAKVQFASRRKRRIRQTLAFVDKHT